MDRVYTGFESLDKHLKISKGDLVVIGGRPAVGKTCFLRSMIEKTASMQKILFFTMLMKKHKAIEGLMSLNTKTIFFWENIVDFEELLMIVAEHKLKYDIDAVVIDNVADLLEYTYHLENETVIKLKELATKLNVAIIIADSHKWTGKKYSCYMELRHKSFIKYADKILAINRPDKTATERELKEGFIKRGIAEIRVEKDMQVYLTPSIELEFDSNTLTFNEN